MIVSRQIKDTNISLRSVLEALDHNLTVADNFTSGQGGAITNADGTLAGATAAINAVLTELRRQGIIS